VLGRHPLRAGAPTNTELVRATLRGIRRTLGTAPAQKAQSTAQLLARMVALCPRHARRALLALGFAGAFRRSAAADFRPR
jgi:hypothetical protein